MLGYHDARTQRQTRRVPLKNFTGATSACTHHGWHESIFTVLKPNLACAATVFAVFGCCHASWSKRRCSLSVV